MIDGAAQAQGRSDSGPGVSVEIDLRVYSIQAVKKACYALGSIATSSIQLSGEQKAMVSLLPRGLFPEAELVQFFQQELLDQDLREIIARETEPLRNLIFAHALSKVPLLNTDLEGDPPVS